MTTTCDVGTQTTYAPLPLTGPNVATLGYDEHSMNSCPMLPDKGAMFSPNKSEAAFALSSLFHGGGGDEGCFSSQASAMTTNDSTASPDSATTTCATLRPNCMGFIHNSNANNVDINYPVPTLVAQPTCCCRDHHHFALPQGQANHTNNISWGPTCCCQNHHCHSHPPSQTNNNNDKCVAWDIPRVSPAQFHIVDEKRSHPNWNTQPDPSGMPTPSHWVQTQAASRNPMDVILEAARFAPSPIGSTDTFRGEDEPSGKRLRDISNDQAFVTPTPTSKDKKQRVDSREETPSQSYSRKNKSLGVLAESFVRKYESSPEGTNIVIDDTAIEFQVERRRIYDIIAILESLEFITRRHKNTYSWNGRTRLNQLLGRLQAEAIKAWPHVAAEAGLVAPQMASAAPIIKDCGQHEHKSLGRLTQTYLKLFLAGHKPISLPEASDIMHGDALSEEDGADADSTDLRSKLAASRILKTRIRRLYDIANCASRIGFLRKVDSDDSRRPKFAWSYPLTPLQIKQLHDCGGYELDNSTTSTPFAQLAPDACNGQASSPSEVDRLFLAHIHERGAEDDCAKPKAIAWTEPVSTATATNENIFPHGVGPRTVSMSSDWEYVTDHGHGVPPGALFHHRQGAGTSWENGNAQPHHPYYRNDDTGRLNGDNCPVI